MNTENSVIQNLVRGGQMTMHSLRMLSQVLRYSMLATLCGFVVIFSIWSCSTIKGYDFYLTMESFGADLKMQTMGERSLYSFTAPNGRQVTMQTRRFMDHPERKLAVKSVKNSLLKAFQGSLMVASLGFLVLVIWLQYKGSDKTKMKLILGQVRTTPKALKKRLKKLGKASSLEIGGVPLVSTSEYQHILLAGTTGTGKSVCMQELMDQVRSQGQRAIVYDIDGAFIPHYFREGHDILLNPLDARTQPWNLWQECSELADFESLAHSLMPMQLQSSDPFWVESARSVFSTAASKLQEQNRCQNKFLLETLFGEDLKSLASLLVKTPAQTLMSDRNEKTSLSIKATLATYCKSLTYLPDDAGPLFSIREWVMDEQTDAWLFIASDSQKMDALRPLISLWLDLAIKSVLSLRPSPKRHLWFFLDELASLQRLANLSMILSRGRKYGACVVAAFQDLHQLMALYDKHEAEVLNSLFNTKVFYRSQEPNSAAWMSKIMGNIESLEQKEGFSYGAHAMRDGVSIHTERRQERVVKETEFLNLPDLEAFLKLAGDYPITSLRFKAIDRSVIAPAFVKRALILPKSTLEDAPKEDSHTLLSDVTLLVPQETEEKPNETMKNKVPKADLVQSKEYAS